jgi:hypothetical protein
MVVAVPVQRLGDRRAARHFALDCRVVPLELRRSDIGFGRVVVNDSGVTRYFLRSAASIAWDEIRDYRLTIEIRGARLEVLYLVRWIDVLLVANDVRNGYRGDHRMRSGIVLLGDHARVAFNWRFRGAEIAIARILHRVHGRLAAPVHAGFARHGIAQFGPLTIGEHAIRWADKPPLARVRVESIELFNSSPIRLRVMARRKVLPYGQAELGDIPNLAAALELAEQQGYPVHGRGLLARLALGEQDSLVTGSRRMRGPK